MTAMATQAGIILGTAAYMSPEQAKGKPVDRRADIWAFGIVLFEMLTGKQVFRGETVSETLAAVMMKDIGWGLLPADTPPPIHRLLRRCLDKDPKRRLRDIGEARVALEGYLADPSTSTVVLESGDIAATAAAAAPQPAWRRALPWVLVAAMALVAVLTVWSPWRQVRVRPSPVRLDVNVSGDEPIFVNRGASAVLSPDGSRLVFVAGTGQERKLYLRALDQLEATPLSGTEGASDPFFSPNGQWVAFFAGGKLKKVSVQGGAPVTLCDAVQARGGTWGPDDTIVFAPSNLGGLSRVSAAGGEPEPLTVLDTSKNERSHRWPFFLPNGKAVLFFAQIPGDSYIEAVVLETGEQKLVHRGGTYPRFLPTGHLLFVREGTMFATPFDPVRLEVTGQPAPVVDGVLTNPSGGGSQYAFSQTGTLVYLSGTQAGARTSVVWVDRKGALKPLVADKADYEDLRLSPDGKRLAVELNMPAAQDIVWVYDIERGTMSRLTFSAGGSYNPVWTPDGQRLAYASDTSSERGTRPNLFWKRADGVGEAERLTTSKNVQLASSWSPDGQVLLFNEQDPTNSWDIRALRVGENTEPETFLSTPFIEENAVFSPDGQWLAYESNESGEFQVYVRPFSGAGGKWQISTEGGLDARWSADGRELFYRSGDKVMVVSVSAQGESVRAGKPRQLFSVHPQLVRRSPPASTHERELRAATLDPHLHFLLRRLNFPE
jgi:serine/threonine-protein kinase